MVMRKDKNWLQCWIAILNVAASKDNDKQEGAAIKIKENAGFDFVC